MFYIFLILWLGFWSAESGASYPWSKKWQDLVSWGSEVPEAVLSLTIGLLGTFGYCLLLGINPLWSLLMFPLPTAIVYAGQQSATWAYLRWSSHANPDKDRESTLKGLNDFMAGLLGYKLGDEGYSWVWAATKGFIITLPIGGIGAITFPLGHELGSHAKGRLPGDPNMWKEQASGWGLGLACIIYLLLVGAV
jgi:hypothetical protein